MINALNDYEGDTKVNYHILKDLIENNLHAYVGIDKRKYDTFAIFMCAL
jgi:hypothetical protein